ncbi:MAG: SCO family protein [Magnetococcales bacterium]|nr:SCO family protein [Magnetococcales bacterium]
MNQTIADKHRTFRRFLILVFSIGLLAFAAMGGFLYLINQMRKQVPEELANIMLPETRPVPAFALMAHDGTPFTLDRLKDTWSLLFFGYTHCPDVCPTALAAMGELLAEMKKNQVTAPYQGVFVSVDPQRDTQDLLKDYVAFFSPRITGVTGDEPVIKDLAKSVGAYYAREAGRGDDSYLIDHTSHFFLIDPKGRLTAVFAANRFPPAEAADKVRRIIRHVESNL